MAFAHFKNLKKQCPYAGAGRRKKRKTKTFVEHDHIFLMESIDCLKHSNGVRTLQKLEKQCPYAGAGGRKKPKTLTFVEHDDIFLMEFFDFEK